MLRHLLATVATMLLLAGEAWASGPGVQTAAGELLPSTLELDAELDGALARVTLTLEFRNEGKVETGGELVLPLPPRAVVTDHAIDIEGRLVHASVVERHRARAAMEEERYGRSIDPGLVEWSVGNAFRTQVWPVPPGGSRTVLVAWDEWLAPDADGRVRCRLPIGSDATLATARVSVSVRGDRPAATVLGGADLELSCSGPRCVAESTWTDVQLHEDIVIEVEPDLLGEPLITGDGDETWFAFHARPPADARARQLPARRIAVWWDRSAGRHAADLGAELSLLALLLDRLAPLDVVLVDFDRRRSAGRLRHVTRGRGADIARELGALPLRAGTDLSQLELGDSVSLRGGTEASVDWHLVFTDGVATLNPGASPTATRPVFAVSSSRVANGGWLRSLGARSGGAWLPLTGLDPRDAAALIGWSPPRFAVRALGGAELVHPVMARLSLGPVLVTGRFTGPQARLELDWAGHRTTRVLDRSDARDGLAAGRAWARAQVEALRAAPEPDDAEVLKLARRFGLVTETTSLLVLETLDQHLRHDVAPSPDRPEMRKRYFEEIGRALESREWDREHARDQLYQDAEDLAHWAATDCADLRARHDEHARERAEERAEKLAVVQEALAAWKGRQAPPAKGAGLVLGQVVGPEMEPFGFVDVFLESEDQSRHWSELADDEGRFVFRDVPVGNYRLYAYAAGFASTRYDGISVTPNRKMHFVLALTPADDLVESLAVDARLHDDAAGIRGRFLRELPLENNSIEDMVALFAGVTRTGSSDSADLSANGGSADGIRYRLNGVPVEDPASCAPLRITRETIWGFAWLPGLGRGPRSVPALLEHARSPQVGSRERLDALTAALDLSPGDERLLRRAALHAVSEGEAELAVELFGQLLTRRPHDGLAHRDLALALRDLARRKPRRSQELWLRAGALLRKVVYGLWSESREDLPSIALVDLLALEREAAGHGVDLGLDLTTAVQVATPLEADLLVEVRSDHAWSELESWREVVGSEGAAIGGRAGLVCERNFLRRPELVGLAWELVRSPPAQDELVWVTSHDPYVELERQPVHVLVEVTTDFGRPTSRTVRRLVELTAERPETPVVRLERSPTNRLRAKPVDAHEQ